jgi:hypothetical protein
MQITREQLETPIAQLEEYGLPVRCIVKLEKQFNAVYIKDLQGMTVDKLAAAYGWGPRYIGQLQKALQAYINATSSCLMT